MTESHGAEGHAGAHVKAYVVVFAALAVFTVVSFVSNLGAQAGTISHFTSFVIILGVAVVKALLVAMYFMHVKIDWGGLYFLIIPGLILATVLVLVLLPDMVLAWRF
jgi:caa(3)-type oxidase subunit IV